MLVIYEPSGETTLTAGGQAVPVERLPDAAAPCGLERAVCHPQRQVDVCVCHSIGLVSVVCTVTEDCGRALSVLQPGEVSLKALSLKWNDFLNYINRFNIHLRLLAN